MSRATDRAKVRILANSLKETQANRYGVKQDALPAGGVGTGLASVGGALYDAALVYGAVADVTNIGRPAAAVYGAEGAGSVVIVGGGGSSGGGGGGGMIPHAYDDPTWHTGTLSWVNVNKSGAALADIPTRPHSVLTGIGPNDHHNQATGGTDITVSGAQVVSLNNHDILARHTVAGGANLDVIGLSGAGTLARLTPAQDVSVGIARILRSGPAGELGLGSLYVSGAAEVVQDFRVGPGVGVLFVDVSQGNMGINRPPDPQFDLDIAGAMRAQYLVGRHAIQLKNVLFLCQFDGVEPHQTNLYGDTTSKMGQAGIVSGGVHFRQGKFGKAVTIAAAATNYITNPRFAVNTTGWNLSQGGTGATLTRYGYIPGTDDGETADIVGEYACALSATTTGASNAYMDSVVSVPNGQSVTLSADIRLGAATGSLILANMSGGGILASVSIPTGTGWARQHVTWANSTGSAVTIRCIVRNDSNSFAIAFTGVQCELSAFPTPYLDGSMRGHTEALGYSWTGAAHASTSTRTLSRLQYPASGSINASRGTVMCWVYVEDTSQASDIIFVDGTSAGDIVLRVNAGGALVGYWGTAPISGGTIPARTWTHVAMVYTGGTLILYVDGAAVNQGAASGFGGMPALFDVGRSTVGTNLLNGRIDSLCIVDRACPAKEILSVYESDAPVFAESTVFSFRATPVGVVWADHEGLWVRSSHPTNPQPVLGVYAGGGTGKSWGGASLDDGDLLIGSQTAGHYIKWDASAATMTVSGAINVISVTGLGSLATQNSVSWTSEVTGRPTELTDGRITTAINNTGVVTSKVVPTAAASASTAGLYLGADRMGYYNGSVWRTYMDNTGQFYLAGAGVNGLSWNGTTLAIDGQIVVGTSNKLWLNDGNDGALAIGGSVKASAPFRVAANGSLTATAGMIGGWTINGSNGLTNNGVGMAPSAGGAPHTVRIWAGHATPASAPFRVTEAGNVYLTNIITPSAGGSMTFWNGAAGSDPTDIIAVMNRVSSTSYLHLGKTASQRLMLFRGDASGDPAYIENQGTGNLELRVNNARVAVSQNGGEFSTHGSGGATLGRITSAGVIRSRKRFAGAGGNNYYAACIAPEEPVTLGNSASIDLDTLYGLIYVIDSSTGQSAMILMRGPNLPIITNQTSSNEFTATLGTAGKTNIAYDGAVMNFQNLTGATRTYHFIIMAYNGY